MSLHALSALDLLAAYHRRDLSPVAVVQAVLDRMARWEPHVRAMYVIDAERALARAAATDGSLWLFSSSEAAGHLPALLPGQDWRRARAIATHPRIADTVRSLGFSEVIASRPGFEDVVASIESAR